ncbi:hypothetical protein [Methylobacillus sp.]|uniref:hypothetical protein n=1 Tax=Methylobacillus sp. TaxID=56818 RepID=UPI002FDF28C3
MDEQTFSIDTLPIDEKQKVVLRKVKLISEQDCPHPFKKILKTAPDLIARARTFIIRGKMAHYGQHSTSSMVDWFRILADLNKIGISLHATAEQTSIPYSTLQGYKGGAEPKYSTGCTLVALWSERTGKAEKDVPMVDRYSYKR